MSKLIVDVSYHNGVINSGFVTFQNVKDLVFRLESICIAMQLATDRQRVSLTIS